MSLRGALLAAAAGDGLAVIHSHPAAAAGDGMRLLTPTPSGPMRTGHSELTGLPLIGMTLAGIGTGPRGVVIDGEPTDGGESVGHQRTGRICLQRPARPAPAGHGASQCGRVTAWGEAPDRDIARLRVLVVGRGSVGLDVAQRLAATGITTWSG